jgi:hypothetical protein
MVGLIVIRASEFLIQGIALISLCLLKPVRPYLDSCALWWCRKILTIQQHAATQLFIFPF